MDWTIKATLTTAMSAMTQFRQLFGHKLQNSLDKAPRSEYNCTMTKRYTYGCSCGFSTKSYASINEHFKSNIDSHGPKRTSTGAFLHVPDSIVSRQTFMEHFFNYVVGEK